MSDTPELYHHGSSVCAAKARIALEEKGVAWVGHYVDILAGEQFRPAFLALNPRAAVPVMVHRGEVILESTVICEYVDEAFDGPPLTPQDPAGRARMRVWTKRVDEEVHPAVRPLTYVVTHRNAILARGSAGVEEHIESDPHPAWRARKRRWIEDGFAAPDVSEALGTFARLLADMDAALADRDWLAGAQWSLADGALTPYLNRLAILGLDMMWAERPNIARWWDGMRERASFGPALNDWLPQGLRERMVEDGRIASPELARILVQIG